eukprot:726117-Rhodomonas_salina.1
MPAVLGSSVSLCTPNSCAPNAPECSQTPSKCLPAAAIPPKWPPLATKKDPRPKNLDPEGALDECC